MALSSAQAMNEAERLRAGRSVLHGGCMRRDTVRYVAAQFMARMPPSASRQLFDAVGMNSPSHASLMHHQQVLCANFQKNNDDIWTGVYRRLLEQHPEIAMERSVTISIDGTYGTRGYLSRSCMVAIVLVELRKVIYAVPMNRLLEPRYTAKAMEFTLFNDRIITWLEQNKVMGTIKAIATDSDTRIVTAIRARIMSKYPGIQHGYDFGHLAGALLKQFKNQMKTSVESQRAGKPVTEDFHWGYKISVGGLLQRLVAAVKAKVKASKMVAETFVATVEQQLTSEQIAAQFYLARYTSFQKSWRHVLSHYTLAPCHEDCDCVMRVDNTDDECVALKKASKDLYLDPTAEDGYENELLQRLEHIVRLVHQMAPMLSTPFHTCISESMWQARKQSGADKNIFFPWAWGTMSTVALLITSVGRGYVMELINSFCTDVGVGGDAEQQGESTEYPVFTAEQIVAANDFHANRDREQAGRATSEGRKKRSEELGVTKMFNRFSTAAVTPPSGSGGGGGGGGDDSIGLYSSGSGVSSVISMLNKQFARACADATRPETSASSSSSSSAAAAAASAARPAASTAASASGRRRGRTQQTKVVFEKDDRLEHRPGLSDSQLRELRLAYTDGIKPRDITALKQLTGKWLSILWYRNRDRDAVQSWLWKCMSCNKVQLTSVMACTLCKSREKKKKKKEENEKKTE